MLVFALLFLVFHLAQPIWTAVYTCNQSEPCGCSQSFPVVGKLVGGESAVVHSWGWAVSLQNHNGHFCGGVILSKHFVLTAAHCTIDIIKSISNITVCAGTNRLNETCPQRRSVESIINHPNYRSRTFENDIALIRITPPFDMSDKTISRICIPGAMDDEDYPKPRQDLVAIGWGSTTGRHGDVSMQLQQVTLKVINKTESKCANMLNNDQFQFCASAPNKGTCYGDSGGPIMLYSWLVKRWFLVGLTSYGSGNSCTDSSNSGVETRVTAYRSFIDQHVPIYSCSCHCPQGHNSGTAFTTTYSYVDCVDACMSVPSNPCSSHNTYACRGGSCAYSRSYNQSKNSPLTTTQEPSEINWEENWAHACDFHGRNLAAVKIIAERCGPKCGQTVGCTHFTWTPNNGGICQMKKGHVSKSNAFYTGDYDMVCGVHDLSLHQPIKWKGNWAHACDFHGKNLAEVKITANRCGPKCGQTAGCTHFTWTPDNDGICYMKSGRVSKSDAFYTYDDTMVCGVTTSG